MRIMMYYDGTDHAREALPVVMMRAKAFDARVDVVSSMPRAREDDLGYIESMNRDLEYIKGVFEENGIRCETHLLITGHTAGEDVANFAGKHRVDEVVIGTDKGSLVERLFKGWMAGKVISRTKCPVLVL